MNSLIVLVTEQGLLGNLVQDPIWKFWRLER